MKNEEECIKQVLGALEVAVKALETTRKIPEVIAELESMTDFAYNSMCAVPEGSPALQMYKEQYKARYEFLQIIKEKLA